MLLRPLQGGCQIWCRELCLPPCLCSLSLCRLFLCVLCPWLPCLCLRFFGAAVSSWIASGVPLFLLPLPVPLIARCGGGPDLFFLSSSATFRSRVAIFCWSALLLALQLLATASSWIQCFILCWGSAYADQRASWIEYPSSVQSRCASFRS